MSKFIATNTYRSYLTTYNNRLKRYLKTDLNTLEDAQEDDTNIILVVRQQAVILLYIVDVALCLQLLRQFQIPFLANSLLF